MRIIRQLILLVTALNAIQQAHCAIPELRDSLPASWEYAPEFKQTPPDEDSWWTRLGDPVLDSLIDMGVKNNFDVLTAMQRITTARAGLEAARAAYYPTVSADAGWTRARQSGLTVSRHGQAVTESYFNLGVSANWEIDVFGRITAQARQKKSPLAGLPRRL